MQPATAARVRSGSRTIAAVRASPEPWWWVFYPTCKAVATLGPQMPPTRTPGELNVAPAATRRDVRAPVAQDALPRSWGSARVARDPVPIRSRKFWRPNLPNIANSRTVARPSSAAPRGSVVMRASVAMLGAYCATIARRARSPRSGAMCTRGSRRSGA
jgi:hypothetical protein